MERKAKKNRIDLDQIRICQLSYFHEERTIVNQNEQTNNEVTFFTNQGPFGILNLF